MRGADIAPAEEEVFRRVMHAVRDISGHPEDRITPDARLMEDLGIYGDDGYELIRVLDDQFEMDWNDFDVSVHFGMEGLGAPLPWHLADSAAYLQHQPITVAQLVDAIGRGRWQGTPRLPRAPAQRWSAWGASWIQFGCLIAVAGGGLVMLLIRAVGE